jgi:diguanylate cyclase (GGDEF)-like protein
MNGKGTIEPTVVQPAADRKRERKSKVQEERKADQPPGAGKITGEGASATPLRRPPAGPFSDSLLQQVYKRGRSESRYRAMVEAFDGLIYISTVTYELEFLNQRFIARLGADAVGQKCYQALHKLQQACPWCSRDRVLQGETVYLEAVSPRDNRWYARTSTPVRHAGKVFIMTMLQDVTERKLSEELTRKLAYFDQLTGLPNRSLCNDRLTMALAQARRHQHQLAVMMLDLDRFKDINDTLGHRVGDTLLQEVAQRLTGLLRKSDTVARIGGDEFILISTEIAGARDAAKIARKILKTFQSSFACEGREVRITASIGLALYPAHGRDIDTLVKHADVAMYRAKQAGRNDYRFFSQDRDVKDRMVSRFSPSPPPGICMGEKA